MQVRLWKNFTQPISTQNVLVISDPNKLMSPTCPDCILTTTFPHQPKSSAVLGTQHKAGVQGESHDTKWEQTT